VNNKINTDILNRRVDNSKMVEMWKEFKDNTWDFQRYFTNNDDVYINALDVGTALFFKRAFNLTEIEENEFKPKRSKKSLEYNLKTIKYILTLAEGIGSGSAKIDSSDGCLTIKCDDRIVFIIVPTKPRTEDGEENKTQLEEIISETE